MWSGFLLSDLRMASPVRGGILRPSEVGYVFQRSHSWHWIRNDCIVYEVRYLEDSKITHTSSSLLPHSFSRLFSRCFLKPLILARHCDSHQRVTKNVKR